MATPDLCYEPLCFFPRPAIFPCFLSLLLWTGRCCNGPTKAMICELFSAVALRGDKEAKPQAAEQAGLCPEAHPWGMRS